MVEPLTSLPGNGDFRPNIKMDNWHVVDDKTGDGATGCREYDEISKPHIVVKLDNFVLGV